MHETNHRIEFDYGGARRAFGLIYVSGKQVLDGIESGGEYDVKHFYPAFAQYYAALGVGAFQDRFSHLRYLQTE
jgi:hypothetical protein